MQATFLLHYLSESTAGLLMCFFLYTCKIVINIQLSEIKDGSFTKPQENNEEDPGNSKLY